MAGGERKRGARIGSLDEGDGEALLHEPGEPSASQFVQGGRQPWL